MKNIDALVQFDAFVFKKGQVSDMAFLEELIFREGVSCYDITDEYLDPVKTQMKKVDDSIDPNKIQAFRRCKPIETVHDCKFNCDAVGFQLGTIIGNRGFSLMRESGLQYEINEVGVSEVISPFCDIMERRVHQILKESLGLSDKNSLSDNILNFSIKKISNFNYKEDAVNLLTAWSFNMYGGRWNAFGADAEDECWGECVLEGFIDIKTLKFTAIREV